MWQQKDILDDDILEIIIGQLTGGQKKFEFNKLQLVTGDQVTSMATVTVAKDGDTEEKAGIGHGPVEAIMTAVNSFLDYSPKLVDWQIQSITKGRDAQGLTHVKVSQDGKIYSGRGLSVNILESSAKAYIDAINKIERYMEVGGESNGDDHYGENISSTL